jgi:hypothetical protein
VLLCWRSGLKIAEDWNLMQVDEWIVDWNNIHFNRIRIDEVLSTDLVRGHPFPHYRSRFESAALIVSMCWVNDRNVVRMEILLFVRHAFFLNGLSHWNIADVVPVHCLTNCVVHLCFNGS